MKLTCLLLCLSVSIAFASHSYAQTTTLSLSMTEKTVAEVLDVIESKTDFHFFYNSKLVDMSRKVSVKVEKKDVIHVLNQIFDNSGVCYKVVDKDVILTVGERNVVSQQSVKKITGVVKDKSGEPIIGANVVEKGTTNGTITDLEGRYSIQVSPSATLQFSYIGYNAQEIKADNRNKIDIKLTEDTQMLEEVVVVGYGTMRKKDLTGAITQVRPDQLAKESPSTVQDLLRSGVPGLNVGVSASAKGGGALQIRGQRSLAAKNDPLLVVDNVVFFGELSEINPQDIEQIDILKDASSAAIFGAKSANGVIIITTKKGKTDKPVVRFDVSLSAVTLGEHRDVYDADGYLQFRSDWYNSITGFKTPGKYTRPTSENLSRNGLTIEEWRNYTIDKGSDDEIWLSRLGLFDLEKQNFLNGRTYDWLDEAYRTGFKQDYNASFSGRGEKINYYMSIGYLDSKGLVKGDDYTSIRSNFKMDATVNNFLYLGANINFQNRTDGNLAVSPEKILTSNSPYALPYDEEGNLILKPMGTNTLNEGWNYRFDRQYRDLDRGYTILNTILTAKVKLPFNINYTLNFAPRFQWYHDRYHESSQHPEWKSTHNGAVNREQTQKFDWVVNNTINWEYTFAKKHNVNVTLSQEAEEHKSWKDRIEARDFTPTDALGFHYVNGADKLKSSFSSDDMHSTGDALLARLFYSFDNRYMTTLSVRRDGYSAFGTSNPRALFTSAALAWNFKNEKFFTWEAMSQGKLRVSWGINGNRDIGIYDALANLITGSGPYPYIDSNNTLKEISQLYVVRMANPNLRWEKTSSWNFGLDFGFLNNRISGSMEYYHMPTTDLIMGQSLPNITGYGSVTTNLGEVMNKGFELTLNTINIQSSNFEWRSTLNVSLNRNKIKHLYYTYENMLDDKGNIIGTKEIDDRSKGWFIGKDINEIWNYKLEGIWQKGEEEQAALYGQVPGDPKVKDSYEIEKRRYSDDDKEFLGSKSPKFRWSLRNDFSFLKNFTASMNIYSIWGHKGGEEYINNGYGAERYNSYEQKYWTPENPTNNYARLGATNKAPNAPRIIDKSFIRLESISLEYSVPTRFLSKFNIAGLRFSGSVRNIAVWTKEWQYTDPEYGYVPRSFNFGASLTF